MKVLAVVSTVTVVIAMLSCVWAQDAAQGSRGVRALKTSKLSEEEFVKEFQEECRENGGPSAFNNVAAAANELKTCLSRLVVEKEFADVMQEDDSSDIKQFMNKYCKLGSKAVDCVDKFEDVLTTCLDADDKAVMDDAVETVGDLIEFLCEDDGEHVVRFITKGGPQCVQQNMEPLTECAKMVVPANFTADQGDDKEDDAVFSREQGCKMMMDFKPCMARSLKSCKDPADVLDDFLDTMYDGLCSKSSVLTPSFAWAWVVLAVLAKYW